MSAARAPIPTTTVTPLRRVTFSRNLTLSLSRTCRCYCKYCAFATHQAHIHDPDAVRERLDEAARRNVKGQPVGHVGQGGGYEDTTTVLYDLENDPDQLRPFRDEKIEARLLGLMADLMRRNEAPPEAFLRLGLDVNG